MATVAAVQMTSGPEPAANLQVAARLIAEAAGQGAELVLLPECFAAMGTSSLAAIAEAEWGASMVSGWSAAACRCRPRLAASQWPVSW